MFGQNSHPPSSNVPKADVPKFQEGLVPLESDYFYDYFQLQKIVQVGLQVD